MKSIEWSSLENALKKCVNNNDTLYYDFEANLLLTIEGLGKEQDEYSKNQEETFSSIYSWKCQQEMQEIYAINAHMKLHFPPNNGVFAPDNYKLMEENKRILLRGVNVNYDTVEFPDPEQADSRHAEAIFNMGKKAIEMFQAEPTALIVFPGKWIPKIQAMYDFRIISGNANSRSEFNTETLRLYFRDINPYFKITVCTVKETQKVFYKGDPKFINQRKIAVLFTYANLI